MKILLIRLNYEGFPVPPPDMPLGLLYIAAVLEEAGNDVVLRDLNRQSVEKEILDEVKNGTIQMVGITMLSCIRSEGYSLIKTFRALNPRVKIVIGGIHAMPFPERLIEKYPLDACVIGEGERTIVELAAAWENQNGIADVAGICSREHGMHGERPLIENLDSVPFPAWHHSNFDWFKMTCAALKPDLTIRDVRIGDARWANIIASRGCVGRCIFCNAWKHWGGKVRFRSAENILDEVQELYENHNIRLLAFNDDAFPMKHSQCVEFCEGLLKRDLKIAWQTTTRADMLSDEICELMHEAGCFMVAVGIESGSPAIHTKLDKRLNLEKAAAGIASINKSGMISYALLMIGNPGESDETIGETIEYLKKTRPKYHSYVTGVMIVPGTGLCDMAVRAGQINNDMWFEEGRDGLPYYLHENSMEQLASYALKIEEEIPRCL